MLGRRECANREMQPNLRPKMQQTNQRGMGGQTQLCHTEFKLLIPNALGLLCVSRVRVLPLHDDHREHVSALRSGSFALFGARQFAFMRMRVLLEYVRARAYCVFIA